VEDGADGCFLLREEWGFQVISSEAETPNGSEITQTNAPRGKNWRQAVASREPAGAKRRSLPVRHQERP
jgi:hypothetical protein